MTPSSWSIWVDTGGTFTDAVGVRPDGRVARAKILSLGALRGEALSAIAPASLRIHASWAAAPAAIEGLGFRFVGERTCCARVARYDPASATIDLTQALGAGVRLPAPFEVVSDEQAPIFAARLLTGTARQTPLPPCRMRVATTLGTNALLERSGAALALFVTRGFRDVLEIGTQQRPDLFRLDVRKPPPLYAEVVEVAERLRADGTVEEPLRAELVEGQARALIARGITVAAVALMHAYRDPRHETELKRRLSEWGFRHVSCSAELSGRIKLVERAETAVVDAYLSPLLRRFVEQLAEQVPGAGSLLMMTSAGGLLPARSFRPKDGLLSGPAAGVVGSAAAGLRSGFARVIGFDMGGTSTDVARFDGDHDYRYPHRVGEAQLAAPALAIETVAAGGGSLCWLDGERLRVGPESAAADPGPACYGTGGPLALTDVNLLLGRLDPSRFGIPVSVLAAQERFGALRADLEQRTRAPHPPEPLLEGFLDIANATMADAMRRVSIRRGYDPADHALLAFGGAGGQHACAVAAILGMRHVVVPADAALLSALGLGSASVERFEEAQVLEPLAAAEQGLAARFAPLVAAARAAVARAGVPHEAIVVRRRTLCLRFAGQDSTLEIEWEPGVSLHHAFIERHLRLFGHQPERRAIELESIRVVASSRPDPPLVAGEPLAPAAAVPAGRRRAWFGGSWIDVPTFDRDRLRPGDRFDGPALVFEPYTAIVVESGWAAWVDPVRALVLERGRHEPTRRGASPVEPVRLELFTRRFTSLVEEMGERLARTAVSTNVKERLDFSCALLDPQGELVANAPHIPVHLGGLGLAVRCVARALRLEPGDVAVTNHPAHGGSHLPDVTVVTPVFCGPASILIGYVASRAHHAEIGGSRPGSMPPAATSLAEEGVVLPPLLAVRAGQALWPELRARFLGADYPTRNVEDNLSDLKAAIAANHAGADRLRALVTSDGSETVLRYMRKLEEHSAARMREALARHGDGRYEARELLDDGTPLSVAIELARGRARIDFAGSGGVHAGNLNATPAIVRSAVIYVLRLLLAEPLPLNEGLLEPVEIEVPRGILNPDFPDDPRRAPAVAGGNVETSQRLVDTLLRALGLAACSQGTMNNLIFGNAGFGYYETLGGGVGAGPGFHGASAVHSHMTNTRITDPEVLETRYPVRLERFAVRRGSGGAGRYHGGDGMVRELLFLEPVTLSVLSQHRTIAPYGMHGGKEGARGCQHVRRASGGRQDLGSCDGADLAAGDRLVIETPGGGGWGAP